MTNIFSFLVSLRNGLGFLFLLLMLAAKIIIKTAAIEKLLFIILILSIAI